MVCLVTQSAAPSPFALPGSLGSENELDDPFAGLLGNPSPREDLWLGKPVPRYTSYPPATAFQNDVRHETYEAALSLVPPEQPVSLYLHVPFCKSVCLYCGCHTCPTQDHDKIARYMTSMSREMELVAATAPRSRKISHIHFGGGSPNILSEKDWGLVMNGLARRFDLSSCNEIAVELDPRLVTKAQARTLGLLGVTRVSLGVQDFDPEVQHAIGRVQDAEMIAQACAELREAGIARINFDLMYGLPFQSPLSVAETARRAVKMKPDRIALFSYAHVPQVKKHQRALEQYVLPGPALTLALENASRNVLREAAYVEIGIDHFARADDPLAKAAFAGKIRRNFQGYTDDTSPHILGLGASSIGRVADHFYQNIKEIDAYQARIAEGTFATTRGLRVSGEDKLRGAIIESLMCTMSVDIETVCHDHHYSPAALSASLEKLKVYEDAGLMKRKGGRITLATRNRMAVRVIAACFDTYIRTPETPVSRAV